METLKPLPAASSPERHNTSSEVELMETSWRQLPNPWQMCHNTSSEVELSVVVVQTTVLIDNIMPLSTTSAEQAWIKEVT